jgi:hypothetical protein
MRVQRACLAAVAATVLLAMPAHAATGTITFDDLPAGTKVLDQYNGTLGVRFQRDYFDNLTDHPITVRSTGAQVWSAPNAADAFYPWCGKEFCDPHATLLEGGFSYPKQFVALRASTISPGVNVTTTLTTYDVNNVPHSQTQTVGYNGKVFFRVDAVGNGIAAFALSGQSDFDAVHVDQVEFDVPDNGVTPAPDFGITRTDNAYVATVGLRPGDSAQIPFRVTRFGSTGAIDLSATGLPTGVHASFTPAQYTDAAKVGSFTLTLSADADAPGKDAADITIKATPHAASAGANPRTVVIPSFVQANYDLGVPAPEVFQAVSDGMLFASTSDSQTQRAVTYNGVPLVAGKRTIVRGYATAKGAPKTGIPTTGLLYGKKADGTGLPGSPLHAEQGDVTIFNFPDGEFLQRPDLTKGFTYTLPPSWTTSGPISLTFSVSGPQQGLNLGTGSGVPLFECDDCKANNTFTVNAIPFTPTVGYTINPVQLGFVRPSATGNQRYDLRCSLPAAGVAALRYLGDPPGCLSGGGQVCARPACGLLRDPAEVVRQFMIATPIADGQVNVLDAPFVDVSDIAQYGFDGVKDANGNQTYDNAGDPIDNNGDGGDVKNGAVLNRMAVYELTTLFDGDPHAVRGNMTLGINEALARGLEWNLQSSLRSQGYKVTVDPLYPIAVINQNYGGSGPGGDDMHELYHAFGRKHASAACGGGAASAGGSDPWPTADGVFETFDMGLDSEPAFKSLPEINQLIGYGQTAKGYDVESYCAYKGVPWTSSNGWKINFNALLPARRRTVRALAPVARAAAKRSAVFEVRGFVTDDGTTQITSSQEQRIHEGDPTPGTDLTATLVSGSGKPLASVPMNVSQTHIDHTDDGVPHGLTIVSADLPAGKARKAGGIQLAQAGKVLATRKRSKHKPTAKLLKPQFRKRNKIKVAIVRYRVHDKDKGSHLTVAIEYAANGRRFHALWAGPAAKGGKLVLPRNKLGAGRHARLRLTVSDGWNQRRVVSKRFRSPGGKPRALIIWPAPGQRISSRASLFLSGSAADDRGRALHGLRWYVGRRLVARGAVASATRLPRGARVVRLVARDGHGRRGTARVRIRVTR